MITPTQKLRLESWNQRNAADASVSTNMDRKAKVVAVMWDFAVNGGSFATDINLGYTFEEDCLVTRIFMREITNVVGATSTYTLEANATALTTDVAVASMATGQMTLAASATAIAVTAGEVLQLNIGTANATAGKVLFIVEILPSRVN